MSTKKYVLLTAGVLYPLVSYDIKADTIKWREDSKVIDHTIEEAENSVCVIDLTNSNSVTDECLKTIVLLEGAVAYSQLKYPETDHIRYIISVLEANNLIVMKHIERFNKFMGYE